MCTSSGLFIACLFGTIDFAGKNCHRLDPNPGTFTSHHVKCYFVNKMPDTLFYLVVHVGFKRQTKRRGHRVTFIWDPPAYGNLKVTRQPLDTVP